MPPPILTTTPSIRVIPEPLTPDVFAPFGTAIVSPLPRSLSKAPPLSSLPAHTPAPELANQSSALKYSPVSPLLNNYPDACPSGKASSARMSMFSCFPRQPRPVVPASASASASVPVPASAVSTASTSTVFDVRILERHPFTTQTFIPIDLSSQESADEPWYLVIVAPTLKGHTASANTDTGSASVSDPPDLNNIRAFVARGGQAVTYGAGTWHAPMVVLGPRRVDFVVVQFVNGVAGEDCQEVAFGEGVEVEVEGEGRRGRASLWEGKGRAAKL